MWEQILGYVLPLVLSTLLTTLIGLWIKKAVAKKIDEHEELFKLRKEKERVEYQAELTKILADTLEPMHNKIDNIKDTLEKDKAGTITLLREAMLQEHDKLVVKGEITLHDLSRWHELYKTYKDLGGNHFAEYVDGWKEDIESLHRVTTINK